MKIAIFGCKKTTEFLLNSLSQYLEIKILITIDQKKGKKFKVADYCDLNEIAKKNNLTVYHAKTYSLKDKEDIKVIKNFKIDLSFVSGWQRLIPSSILNSIPIGVFGMHGSSMNLPLGRGRSPMNWSLIEGRKHFYTNLFKYDSGVDSGDVLDTFKFNIMPNDNARTMHFKNILAMDYLIKKNIKSILNNSFILKKQKSISPTYYPKRSEEDSLIDWDMDIYKLDKFIKAVTKPFNGAFTFIKKKVIIYDAQVFDFVDYGFEDKKNGEIIRVFSKEIFLVKCNGGLLLVNDYFSEDNEILKGKIFNNNDNTIKNFKMNKYGNFDMEE